MSVYEPYATPSRILGVYRYLLHARGHRADRDEVEQSLMPEHLPLKDAAQENSANDEENEDKKDAPKRDMAKKSIDEAISMHLVLPDGDAILLHPDLPEFARSPTTVDSSIRLMFSSLLLSATNVANHDVARALAWFLGQDVYTAPSSWQEVDQKHRSDADELKLTNSRWGQLVHWSRFLGLAWVHAAPEKPGQKASKLALAPDPYWQLRWRLSDLFTRHPSVALPFATVVTDLGASVPVLEGGFFRSPLEGAVLPVRAEHQLSSATAHAWLRLHEEGFVKLAYRSDGTAYVFPRGDGDDRYTELTWLAGS